MSKFQGWYNYNITGPADLGIKTASKIARCKTCNKFFNWGKVTGLSKSYIGWKCPHCNAQCLS